MGPAALCWTTLALLGGGVAPLEPVKAPCEKAAFHEAPATEREWLALTFDVESLRIHPQDEETWFEVRDAKWGPDSLSVVTRWVRGQASQSLSIPWSDIERIDKPMGRRTALGAGVGAVAGVGAGLVIAYAAERDCSGFGCGYALLILPLITVPTGAVVGALVGSTVHKWTPFFCAPSSAPSKPGRSDDSRD